MLRFIIPIILISITVGGFLMFTKPTYEAITSLRTQATSFNQALDNSKSLENQRDKLTQKLNNIPKENIEKLQKLLPDNVDNIRLILEIEKIASPYGMVLKDVKYDTVKKDDITKSQGVSTAVISPVGNTLQAGSLQAQGRNSEYGTWSLGFSTTSTYSNFLNFIKDLEDNLRIVDVASIEFSSNVGGTAASADIYTYTFKINTYWLKN